MEALIQRPDEFLDSAAIQNPYPIYDRLRNAGPVHRIGDSAFYVVCSWDAVNEAVNRPEDFSSNLTALITYTVASGLVPLPMDDVGGPTQVLATADDPAHALHRKALLPRLAAKRVQAMRPYITETLERLWDEGLNHGSIEWMGALANRLPMMIVVRLIGAPDDDADQLIDWAYVTTQMLDGLRTADEVAASGAAAMEMAGYILNLLEASAADPGPNLVGDLATAVRDGHLDERTILTMMLTLFSAGGESTASLLGTAAWILATNSDAQRRLRERRQLVTAFIEETLRFEPPFRGHYRHVVHDCELGGVALPGGSRLLLLWGAANRDPNHFDAPNEFSMDRGDAKGHMTFGKGIHFCVGAALARLEAAMVLEMLLERTSWIDAVDVGPWLPSILVRRHAHLELVVQ